jgi:hypothetical protein
MLQLVESRQVTDKTISYYGNNRKLMKWQEHVLGLIKPRIGYIDQSSSAVSGHVPKYNPIEAEILFI